MGTENSVSALDICNLDVSYPGREVLKSVSLTVAPGEFCALIGPNGAGKSDMFRSVMSLPGIFLSASVRRFSVREPAGLDGGAGLRSMIIAPSKRHCIRLV